MKKTSIILAIIIFIISLSGCANIKLDNSISRENLKEHIDLLTSSDFEGRLMGTEGNKKVIEYINNHFNMVGLDPVVGDTFTQTFKGMNVTYNDEPIFKVVDGNGDMIDTFTEGLDYKIRLDDSAMNGSFQGNMEHIENKSNILRNEFRYEDVAVLLDFTKESIQETYLSESEIVDRIFYKGSKLLIYPDYSGVSKKEVQLGTKNAWGLSSGLIKLGMDPAAFEKLLSYSQQGYKLDVNVPIDFNEAESSNVVGMIKGKINDYNNIIIATSIDGLGLDANGKAFPNAVDNGASIALLLELSRIFQEEGARFDSNIIFLALNGNKLGDRGFDSYFRIEDISPARSQVIYLDKIGTINGDLNIGTFTSPSTEFKINTFKFNEILETVKEMDIAVNQQDNYYDSDYTNFRFRGIPALVLTNGDNENIGTVNDNKDNLDIKNVVEAGDLVLAHINKVGNINILKELYELVKSIWVLLLIGIMLIFGKFYVYEKRRTLNLVQYDRVGAGDNRQSGGFVKKRFKLFMDKPIVSIYLIVMFYTIIMIVHAKQSALLSEGVLISDVTVDYIAFIYAIINNIITTGPMLAFSSLIIGLLLVGLIGIRVLSEKFKLSKGSNILISVISSYIAMIIAVRIFYRYDYALIFPRLLSLPNSYFVAILVVAMYSFLVVYVMSKELNDFSSFKWAVAFIFIFFIFTSIIYSPYLFNKVVINLRNGGGRIRL